MQRISQILKTRILHHSARQMQPSMNRNFHKYYNAELEEQSLKLSDGRTMGFAEYGSTKGIPAIFLHGSPGTRYCGADVVEAALKLNLRVICPDRPGMGTSTPKPDLTILDYPDDIRQLAQHLGLTRYHIFGMSGGGLYTAACAYKIPSQELINASIIAGGGPTGVLTLRETGLYSLIVTNLARYTPSILRSLIKLSLRQPNSYEKQYDSFVKYFYTAQDRQLHPFLGSPEDRAIFIAYMKETYAQGPDGPILDGHLQELPLAFKLENIRNKVLLFYGAKDTRTPLAWGRHYRDSIPGAVLTEYPEDSHFTIFRHVEEIFSKMVEESGD